VRAAVILAALSCIGAYAQVSPPGADVNSGWVSLFNGSTLEGWDGRSDIWKVEDGAITGQTLAGPSSVTDTTYIFWKGGEPADFELKAEIRTEGSFVNSGIVYRGFIQPTPPGRGGPGGVGGRGGPGPGRGRINNAPYLLAGPQLDFDGKNRYSGQYFEIASQRGLLARRGQIVETGANVPPEVIGSVGDENTLGGFMKAGDWNQVRVIAYGNTLIHVVNGHVMSVLIDKDTLARLKGLLAFQIEGAGKVQFRNIWLKTN
jgi:hypothetical protein